MALLSDLFGEGYVDPRLTSDSSDATTANVLAEMPSDAFERFMATPQGQGIMIAIGLMGRAGGRTAPLRNTTQEAIRSETTFARPRTIEEVGDQLPLPLGDANRYPTTAPRKAGAAAPPDAKAANLAAAEEAASAIRQLGPDFEPVVSPKSDSVYLRVLQRDPDNPAMSADSGFKGRFADHAQMKWASISADPASGNTAADVVRAFRHHAGLDPEPPQVGWSKLDMKGNKEVAQQRGGIGLYERDFREQGRTTPIKKLLRLFGGAGAATAGASADDLTTEDVARLIARARQ